MPQKKTTDKKRRSNPKGILRHRGKVKGEGPQRDRKRYAHDLAMSCREDRLLARCLLSEKFRKPKKRK